LSIAVLGESGVAHAEETDAIQRYEHGVKLYQSGAFEAALVEFQAAYETSKNVRLLFNIGVAANEAREHAVALAAFRKYLSDGGGSIPEEKRSAARTFIEQLELVVRDVSIASNAPDGSEVSVDQRVVGKTPLGPILLKIGRHRVLVTNGDRTGSESMELPSGKGVFSLRVDLPRAGPTTQPLASATADRREPTAVDRPGLPYWAYGLTGVLTAGAIVTGTLAVGAKNDAYLAGATYGVDPSRVGELDSRATGFAVTSDVLLGLTVVSAALATYLTISRLSAPQRAASRPLLTGLGGSF
jgi:hypothetical protein